MKNINKISCLNHLYEELLKYAPILRDINIKLNNSDFSIDQRLIFRKECHDKLRHVYYTFKKYGQYLELKVSPRVLTNNYFENLSTPCKYDKLILELRTKWIEVEEQLLQLKNKQWQ